MQFSIIDYDFALLKNLLQIIDQHLDHIRKEAMEVDDADEFGYFDDGEHVTGLGFVACQTYLSSVCARLEIDKRKALFIGPLHSSGRTKVYIINLAANYWKHHSEGVLIKNSKQKNYAENEFKQLGISVNTDYPLSCILSELTFPGNVAFEPILQVLESWKDKLQKP